jgi:hypothetical protein
MRFVTFLILLALAACSQPAQSNVAARTNVLAGVAACDGQPQPTSPDHPYVARECKIEAGGQTFHVKFASADGDDAGSVTVDVLAADSSVAQTLEESDVSDYADPEAVDFDEDGHVDLEIPLIVGNDNRDLALWRYDPAQTRFVRLGDASGIIRHTRDGYLAVAGRTSAAEWEVAFYAIGSGALSELASVDVAAQGDDQGQATQVTCSLVRQGPAFATLNLSVDAARERFCADPAARVFE